MKRNKTLLISIFLLVTHACVAQSVFDTRIRVGDSMMSPVDGDIRWDGDDFEGYDGSQWKSFTTVNTSASGIVSDIDGNIYRTVQIGEQEWMRENLRTSRYTDGTPISEVTLTEDWVADTVGAWCWFYNDQAYDETCGKIYNFYAISSDRSVCPEGWRIPDLEDWRALDTFLGASISANRLKQVGTSNWNSTSSDVNNDSGFTAIPAGVRFFNGSFTTLGFENNFTSFWSSAETLNGTLTIINIFGTESMIDFDNISDKETGVSVRCIKTK